MDSIQHLSFNKTMKNSLMYTSLDKTYSNHEIKGYMALYSIHIEIEKTISKNLFNLEAEGMVVYVKDGEKASTVLMIPLGIYTLKELEKKFQTGLLHLKLSVENERVMLVIPDGYRVVISPNVINMLGMNIKPDEWISKKNNYSKPFESVERLQLHCKQLDKSKYLIDGLYTNCLCVIPLTINQTVIQYTPQNLIYLPIENPTRYLDFKILDQNGAEVEVKNISLQLLNKQQ